LSDLEPAFPHPGGAGDFTVQKSHMGMTLRDYFAAQAMQGICSTLTPEQISQIWEGVLGGMRVSRAAYVVADAMMEARKP
jgi:hypothetical protein